MMPQNIPVLKLPIEVLWDQELFETWLRQLIDKNIDLSNMEMMSENVYCYGTIIEKTYRLRNGKLLVVQINYESKLCHNDKSYVTVKLL